ncbi:LOW QUALITY PROTEIN: leucine-rich repeat-containing protein 14 [Alca torda]
MHSLLFLCARRLVSHHPAIRRALDLVPPQLFPVLFRAAFLDERTLALRVVGTWPFLLSFQRLLGHRRHRPLLGEKASKLCVQAVILAVVAHLRRALEEPSRDARGASPESRCRLRADMTGLHDDGTDRGPEWMSLWSGTGLAKACLEVSKHQNECLKRGSKRHKGPSGVSAAPQPFGVEIRADLFVNATSFGVLRDALRTAGPLRLKCRDFHAEELSLAGTELLESLEPAGVRRVDLRFNNLGLPGLSLLPHLAGFSDLLSLKLPYSNDVRRLTAGTETGLRGLAQLGRLPRLKELNLGSSRLSGKLRQLLGVRDLQAPLESLELAFCYLLPDLAVLSQSFPPALKKLDLSGHDFSENLLQPLQHLLKRLRLLSPLDLMECLTDACLESLLPVLCRCSRLRCLGLFGNPLSTAGLKTLLRKTLLLPDLRLVVYPYPVDCYNPEPPRPPSAWLFQDALDEERFAAVDAELCRMRDSGRADAVWTASLCHGALDYFAL